jgi:DNA-binding IclR family transcriptional regulator
MTACELGMFMHLSLGPLTAEDLAQRCQLPSRGLQRLLNACVVLELIEKEDERYHNTPIAQMVLVQS